MLKNIIFLMFIIYSIQGMQTDKHIIYLFEKYIEQYHGLQFDTEFQPIDKVLFLISKTENCLSNSTARLIIKKAIQAGANIEAKDIDGRTPLIKAAISNSIPVLKALCEADAQMNTVDIFGHTALDSAASRGHVQAVLELIRSGINVNTIDAHHITPLIYAILQCQRECIIALLQHGADPTIPDENGATALHYAETIRQYIKEDKEISTLLQSRSKI